jgi:phosphatidylglycerophosphate synthase
MSPNSSVEPGGYEVTGMEGLRRHRNAHARGGFAWTWHISQIIGTVVARWAERHGLTPNQLSVANVVLAWAGAAVAMFAAPSVAVAAIAVVVLWQLAYAFDCADGQLARSTSIRNPNGALVDVLCDFFAQLAVLTAVAERIDDHRPIALYVALGFAAWFGPFLYASVSDARQFHLIAAARGAVAHAVLGLQDYGLHVFLLGIALFLSERILVTTFGLIVALNVIATALRLVVLVGRGPSHGT